MEIMKNSKIGSRYYLKTESTTVETESESDMDHEP